MLALSADALSHAQLETTPTLDMPFCRTTLVVLAMGLHCTCTYMYIGICMQCGSIVGTDQVLMKCRAAILCLIYNSHTFVRCTYVGAMPTSTRVLLYIVESSLQLVGR